MNVMAEWGSEPRPPSSTQSLSQESSTPGLSLSYSLDASITALFSRHQLLTHILAGIVAIAPEVRVAVANYPL